ncbi:MAG: DUF134 domain-containing protein [Calditrichaeota bacterium]|nr:DUF134 domain-containing protein [Calditrichota bacterium]
MKQPYRRRRIDEPPKFLNFKPSGIPRGMLKKIEISLDEYEAIRLADYMQLEHEEASEKMNISRPTFTRLIRSARQKVAKSIIEGHELIIKGGNIELLNALHHCKDCGETVSKPIDETEENCPECGSDHVENLAKPFMKNESK